MIAICASAFSCDAPLASSIFPACAGMAAVGSRIYKTAALEIFICQFPAVFFVQFRFKDIAQRDEIMSIESGVIDKRRRQGTLSPIGLLVMLINIDTEFLG